MSNQVEDLNVIAPKGIKIIITGEEFLIKPFVLKNRIEVVRIVAEIIAEMGDQFKDISSVSPMVGISTLIKVAGSRLIEIYRIVLGKEDEWLNNSLELKDEFAILNAIMEVNDLPFLLSQVQGLTQKLQGKK